MNRKIIYVDFIFKRRRIKSKPMYYIYKINYLLKTLRDKIFNKKKRYYENIQPFYKKII
jgi:hypothetical protein